MAEMSKEDPQEAHTEQVGITEHKEQGQEDAHLDDDMDPGYRKKGI